MTGQDQGGLFDAPTALPHGLVYVPEFLAPAEETSLLAAIAPLPLHEAKFREYFAKRRVAHFHEGAPVARYEEGDDDTLASGPPPPFLAALREKVAAHLDLRPEDFVHVLVSEYRPGTPIGWHRDRPEYGIVAGISLGSVARMRWRPYAHQDARYTFSLDLAPRSLYVMRGPIRWQWQHSMPPVRELRYSITLRTRAAPGEREF
ncbi:MAG: alpha-ketoglutarate-dependent dioxygenase AlkB [Burkholderiales bacterium]